ncbi:DUF4440 domain-containing protein [uncultured Croceitalea sp.]|uniref:YybH family protein n=1 Tax=uncultured Croceitalea sp. TaxID=1798908 RepID=UPI003306475A
MKTISLFILIFICIGCKQSNNKVEVKKWKAEIAAAEKAFNDMAQKEGLIKAFEFYAAHDGVIRRGKKVVKGKKAIHDWYKEDVKPNESLTWKPTFIDVSQSGDMGYTYGDYIFTYSDSLGNLKKNTGIFHTVWKRQTGGRWKFVWD